MQQFTCILLAIDLIEAPIRGARTPQTHRILLDFAT